MKKDADSASFSIKENEGGKDGIFPIIPPCRGIRHGRNFFLSVPCFHHTMFLKRKSMESVGAGKFFLKKSRQDTQIPCENDRAPAI